MMRHRRRFLAEENVGAIVSRRPGCHGQEHRRRDEIAPARLVPWPTREGHVEPPPELDQVHATVPGNWAAAPPGMARGTRRAVSSSDAPAAAVGAATSWG